MGAKFKDELFLYRHNFVVFGKIGGIIKEQDKIDRNYVT